MKFSKRLLLYLKRNYPKYPNKDVLINISNDINISIHELRNAFKWLRINERFSGNNNQNYNSVNNWNSLEIFPNNKKRILIGKWLKVSEIQRYILKFYALKGDIIQYDKISMSYNPDDILNVEMNQDSLEKLDRNSSIPKNHLDQLEQLTHLSRRQISFMIHYYRNQANKISIKKDHWNIVQIYIKNSTLLESNYHSSFRENKLENNIQNLQKSNDSIALNLPFSDILYNKLYSKASLKELQLKTGLNIYQLRYMIRILNDKDGKISKSNKKQIFQLFEKIENLSELVIYEIKERFKLSKRQILYLFRIWKMINEFPKTNFTNKKKEIIKLAMKNGNVNIQEIIQKTQLNPNQIRYFLQKIKLQINPKTDINNEYINTSLLSKENEAYSEISPMNSKSSNLKNIYNLTRQYLEENNYELDDLKEYAYKNSIPYEKMRRIAIRMKNLNKFD